MSADAEEGADPDDAGAGTPDAARSSARVFAAGPVARLTFAGLCVVAGAYFLVVGRHRWFFRDEWGFLSNRPLSLQSLLRDHGGHLVALPVIEYRILYAVFGLRTYLPYQAVVVLLHIATACLLRAIMRRAGVGPWIATAAASLFLFFGSGGQNILWAFQVTFVGALAFGLAQVVLADHDGPFDRRDWLGLAMGFASILCSGVGVSMLIIVGIAALIRRGWRVAVVHALPLLGLWALWEHHYDTELHSSMNVARVFRWTRRGLEATFRAMGQRPLVGWTLALVLVVGFVLAVRGLPRVELRRELAVPVALLVGVVVFLVMTGVSRSSLGLTFASSSRYLYVVAALLLPPLAVAMTAIVRRRRLLAPVMVLLLLVGLPGNLSKTAASSPPSTVQSINYRQLILSLAHSPLARRAPRSLRPDLDRAPELTVGWLVDGVRSGRIPRGKPSTPIVLATIALRLGLEQLDSGGSRNCKAMTHPVVRTLHAGHSLVVNGTVAVQLLPHDGLPRSPSVPFGTSFESPQRYHTLVAISPALPLRLTSVSPGASAC